MDAPPLTEDGQLLNFRLHEPRMKLGAFLASFKESTAHAASDVFPAQKDPLATDLIPSGTRTKLAIATGSLLPPTNDGFD